MVKIRQGDVVLKEGEKLLPFKKREELREWLIENSTIEKSCWIFVSMKPKEKTILYLDAVEEALCFGWIDGIKKKYSETETAQRLSPRRKTGNWTELNKERVRRLENLGLMTDEGRKVLPNMDPNAFEIHPQILKELKKDEEVYNNFLSFPKAYQRIRIDNLHSCLRDNVLDIYEKRLEKLIENTKQNKMYGLWHDNGRLLEEIK